MYSLETGITKLFMILVFLDVFINLSSRSIQQPQEKKEPQQFQQQDQQDLQQEHTDSQEQEIHQEPQRNNNEQTIPYNIEILYCNRSGLHKTYEDLKQRIYITFPRVNIDIKGSEYPIPEQNKFISQVICKFIQHSQIITYVQYGLIFFMMFFQNILTYFKITVPQILIKIAEKKMFVMMAMYFLVQQLQDYLQKTNGFSIIIDNQMAYTQHGVVDIQQALDNLNQYIVQ